MCVTLFYVVFYLYFSVSMYYDFVLNFMNFVILNSMWYLIYIVRLTLKKKKKHFLTIVTTHFYDFALSSIWHHRSRFHIIPNGVKH